MRPWSQCDSKKESSCVSSDMFNIDGPDACGRSAPSTATALTRSFRADLRLQRRSSLAPPPRGLFAVADVLSRRRATSTALFLVVCRPFTTCAVAFCLRVPLGVCRCRTMMIPHVLLRIVVGFFLLTYELSFFP